MFHDRGKSLFKYPDGNLDPYAIKEQLSLFRRATQTFDENIATTWMISHNKKVNTELIMNTFNY